MSVAPRLLEQVRPHLAGRLVSGDALYCQQTLCRQLRMAGADYLFAVKDNQPSLHDDIALLFRDPPPGEGFLTAQTVDKHGGRLPRAPARASVGPTQVWWRSSPPSGPRGVADEIRCSMLPHDRTVTSRYRLSPEHTIHLCRALLQLALCGQNG